MIEKILNKFGYFKKSEDILEQYIDTLPNLDGDYTEEEEFALFVKLNNIDGLKNWINFVIFRDMKNHYTAVNDKQRDTIRGASQRMLDILKRMKQTEKPLVKSTRISGIRYGS